MPRKPMRKYRTHFSPDELPELQCLSAVLDRSGVSARSALSLLVTTFFETGEVLPLARINPSRILPEGNGPLSVYLSIPEGSEAARIFELMTDNGLIRGYLRNLLRASVLLGNFTEEESWVIDQGYLLRGMLHQVTTYPIHRITGEERSSCFSIPAGMPGEASSRIYLPVEFLPTPEQEDMAGQESASVRNVSNESLSADVFQGLSAFSSYRQK